MQRPCGHTKPGFLGENQAWYLRSGVHPVRTVWGSMIPLILGSQDRQAEDPNTAEWIKQAAMLESGASVGVGARERGGPFYLTE